MLTFFRLSRFGLLTLLVVALGVFAAGFQISKAQTPATPSPAVQPPALSLRLAVLLDDGPTKLAFTATNIGKTNIETTPLATNGNPTCYLFKIRKKSDFVLFKVTL